MAEIKKVVQIEVQTGDSVKKIKEVETGVENLEKQQKNAKTGTKGLSAGFTALGATMKAAGIGLVIAGFAALSSALMKNQEIADGTATVFNGIGVAFKLVSDTLVNVVKRVSEVSENFNGLQKVIGAIINMAIMPLKLQFNSLRGIILAGQLAWESSWLGGGDEVKIAKLQGQLKQVGENIVDATVGQFKDIANIVVGSVEAIGEVGNIIEVVAEETEKTFENVTINTIANQAKLLTEIANNYELLGAKQQRLIEQYDRDAELQRQIRDDVTLTMEERIAANEKLGEILDDQVEAEKGAVQLQIDALNKRVELEGESHQLTKELFDLNTELIAIEAKVVGFQAEQKTNVNALLKEELDLNKQLAAQKKKDGEEEEERIQTELMAKIKAGKDILKATTSIAGESSKVGKAAAVSNILIDTALAISGAVKSAQAMPFPGNLAAIATGIATVMANLRTAKGILSKAGAGDGGDVSVGAVGGTPAMGGIGGTIPNINSISPDAEMQPVQAFVIENEISDAQALQEELEIQATL